MNVFITLTVMVMSQCIHHIIKLYTLNIYIVKKKKKFKERFGGEGGFGSLRGTRLSISRPISVKIRGKKSRHERSLA